MFSSNTSQVAAVATQAEAIDFDGTNDYLRRTSDLTGNTTSKTFTFSAWIWQGDTATSYFYVVSNGSSQRFVVKVVSGTLSVDATSNVGAVILNVTAPLVAVSRTATFYHVLISMDLANAANRSIYINDVAQTLTVTTYTNAAIPFNQVDHVIAGTEGGAAGDKGRLSNVYLDYTYRDLSVTANRRLFVTADLKPAAGQAALNPILYLPMSDPTQPGLNAGTGGNFTLTGTVARSGRGPNQYNAPYSTFGGSTTYLSRTTALTGLSDGKTFTINFSFSYTTGTTKYIVTFGSYTFSVLVNSSGSLNISANNSAGTQILLAATPNSSIVANRNYTLTASMDLSNTANRSIYLNGVAQTVTWSTYTNDTIDFALATPSYLIGKNVSTTYFAGNIGALWFNTSYIDLSVASNLAKFVTGTGIDAKPVDLGANGELPTGTSPLIYLPMYGNNAGKNYGTGGDFTVNSGPYAGARGPNEFWGNKANFNGTTGYLSRTSALSGVSDGNKFVCSFTVNLNAINVNYSVVSFNLNGINIQVSSSTNKIDLRLRNSSGSQLVDATTATALTAATTYTFLICVDLSNSSKRAIYINGVLDSTTWNVYQDGSIYFSAPSLSIGARSDAALFVNGFLSEFYLTTDYIDFSQEANRLKFRDAFGNPTDLPSAITAGTVPNPAIYMRFPPTSFGTNSGTGGNFTVNGTITDGGQL